jgi:hypothetical protein
MMRRFVSYLTAGLLSFLIGVLTTSFLASFRGPATKPESANHAEVVIPANTKSGHGELPVITASERLILSMKVLQ